MYHSITLLLSIILSTFITLAGVLNLIHCTFSHRQRIKKLRRTKLESEVNHTNPSLINHLILPSTTSIQSKKSPSTSSLQIPMTTATTRRRKIKQKTILTNLKPILTTTSNLALISVGTQTEHQPNSPSRSRTVSLQTLSEWKETKAPHPKSSNASLHHRRSKPTLTLDLNHSKLKPFQDSALPIRPHSSPPPIRSKSAIDHGHQQQQLLHRFERHHLPFLTRPTSLSSASTSTRILTSSLSDGQPEPSHPPCWTPPQSSFISRDSVTSSASVRTSSTSSSHLGLCPCRLRSSGSTSTSIAPDVDSLDRIRPQLVATDLSGEQTVSRNPETNTRSHLRKLSLGREVSPNKLLGLDPLINSWNKLCEPSVTSPESSSRGSTRPAPSEVDDIQEQLSSPVLVPTSPLDDQRVLHHHSIGYGLTPDHLWLPHQKPFPDPQVWPQMPIPLGPDNHLLHPTAFTRSPATLETALPYTLPHPHPHHHHPATRSVSTPIRPLHSLWPTPHTPAYPPYFPPTMLPYYHHPTAAPPSYYHTPPPPPPTTTRLPRRRASATPTSMSTPNISTNSKPPRLLSISQNTIRRKQKRNKKSITEEILLEELNQLENNNLLINQDKIKRVVKSLKGRIKELEHENQRLESQLEIAKWRLECIGIEKGLEEIETQKAIHHFLERAERAESYLKIVEMKLDNVIKSSQKNEILESSKLSTNVVEELVENIVDKSVHGQVPINYKRNSNSRWQVAEETYLLDQIDDDD